MECSFSGLVLQAGSIEQQQVQEDNEITFVAGAGGQHVNIADTPLDTQTVYLHFGKCVGEGMEAEASTGGLSAVALGYDPLQQGRLRIVLQE